MARERLISLPFRLSDILFSFVYLLFFINAALFFLSECKQTHTPVGDSKGAKDAAKKEQVRTVPSLLPYIEPVCKQAKHFKLDLAFELEAAWKANVYPAKYDQVLQFISSAVSLVLSPILAVVMVFGARQNNWQTPAIVHATVLLVYGIHSYAAGQAEQPKDKEVFEAAYLFLVCAPLALLHRWWGEKNFTISKAYSGLRGYVSLLTRVACFFGLIFVVTVVFDWAIVSHKEFRGLTKARPFINKYSAAATEPLLTFWHASLEQLEVLGKEVVTKIKDFQK
ncbi:hypothetical protein DIPPA_24115 [Diplonema papillatum]|nr:hypothetical protein DIPPA_24115 [Diplonema papillatum]KAJ9442705.1 hypothetical protein DIPPA_24115 [Diplonema papillatum]